MPFYQFTAPTGSPTLQRKAAVAALATRVHSEVTGAPASYVHCSFVEVPRDSIFVAGEPVNSPRMVGLIRSGRTGQVKSHLLHRLAEGWSAITGEPVDELALFLHEVPGANIMEDGVILPEVSPDEAFTPHAEKLTPR
jgi:phenylpyruvate tautomerase PptA (4-oxalocrotonate tautomerase family)